MNVTTILRARTAATFPPEQRRVVEEVRERLWFGEDDPQRTHVEASRTMAAHAAIASGLKPFPAAAQQALAVIGDPDASMAAIVESIEHEPSLASRLLRVANSASYRGARRCSTIAEAVVRLGNREVTALVAAIATMGLFEDSTGLGADWRDHLAGVAALARMIAEASDPSLAGEAFLAGLVHDLGKLLSLQVKEVPYETLSPKVHARPDELHVVERILVGYDHAVLGAHVLSQWRFSESVTQAVAWHHQPARAFGEGGDLGRLVAIIRVADALEYRMRTEPGPADARFVELMARSSECTYLEIGARTLEAKWDRMVDAVSEMNAVLVE